MVASFRSRRLWCPSSDILTKPAARTGRPATSSAKIPRTCSSDSGERNSQSDTIASPADVVVRHGERARRFGADCRHCLSSHHEEHGGQRARDVYSVLTNECPLVQQEQYEAIGEGEWPLPAMLYLQAPSDPGADHPEEEQCRSPDAEALREGLRVGACALENVDRVTPKSVEVCPPA